MSRPRLVVLRALGLGDLLTAVPALDGLARRFPEHDRVLAAPPALAPLALHTGLVDRVVPTPSLTTLDASVADADIAVNLHGRGPESHRILLATKPKALMAFAHPSVPETKGFPDHREREHEVVRWCRMLAGFGVECDPNALSIAAPQRAGPPVARGAVVVHPGAGSAARRWPIERWATVVQALVKRDERVVVTGSRDERGSAESIARRAGLPMEMVLAGTTDVVDLAAVVAAARRVVCGDTGVAHLATALCTPSVVLFGPTSPELWGPPADRPRHQVLWAGSEGDPLADGRPHEGLLLIRPEDVLERVEMLDDLELGSRAGELTASGRSR